MLFYIKFQEAIRSVKVMEECWTAKVTAGGEGRYCGRVEGRGMTQMSPVLNIHCTREACVGTLIIHGLRNEPSAVMLSATSGVWQCDGATRKERLTITKIQDIFTPIVTDSKIRYTLKCFIKTSINIK